MLLAAGGGAALGDELTERAKALLEQRRAREAYELLLPRESGRAGDIEFDYLLGIAANDAGEPERAVFALERVLALQPGHHLARAEIARAYLALGEREAARRELETVRSQSIPEPAKASIDRLLAAIRAADTTRLEAFLELGFGYDSNVNSATGSSQITLPTAVPLIGGVSFVLDPASRAREDVFGTLSGGVSLTHKLSEIWALIGNAAASARMHEDESRFDQLTLEGSVGARWSRERNAVTVGAQFQSFELDYARYRRTQGLIGQWQHSFDTTRQVSLFGQYAELRYPTQPVRDAERSVIGAAYAQAFAARLAPVAFGSLYAGRERERAADVPHLGHELWGARLGVQLRLGQGWGAVASAAYEARRYGGPDPLFLDTRRDRQSDLSLGVSYRLRANTLLLAQVARTENRSSLALNAFDRSAASVSVRFTY